MNYIYVYALLILLGIVIFLRLFFYKKYNFKVSKVKPKLTLAILTKNNEKLLDTILNYDISFFDEIYIFDIGSIDNTLVVAREHAKKDKRIIVKDIKRASMYNDYYSIIRNSLKSDSVLLLNLIGIDKENPHVYVPDIFKPINEFKNKAKMKLDSRINGIFLLEHDMLERQKNNLILKEYIQMALINIKESLKVNSKYGERDEEISYIDKVIYEIDLLIKLMGITINNDGELDENLAKIFKEYSEKNRVLINFKIIGKVRYFNETINNLILQIVQELLYTVFHFNYSIYLDVYERYGKIYLLMLKFDWIGNFEDFINNKNSLSYYVLQSIKNRLNLISGDLKIKNKGYKVNILIEIPIKNIIKDICDR
ncbi:hypothetical protein [Caloramator australicus]|uniref:Uncharacterized protein n=1 Tax=Caloramator australicus RC3 TaxID=857293 RepID=I7K629_9CLOT|nr:hypothetical protein [Caloramator australicus]CCJ33009.1 hypothetical protein CAAU_0925 [Caloramator australicus RC3]